jgi:tyrosyl-tRNA synthetase
MLRYYELLSHISVDELNALKAGLKQGGIHPKKAKEDLAFEIVERYHGREAAEKAKEEFERVFKQKGLPDEVPVLRLRWEGRDIWLPQIMKLSGLVKSTSEAQRLIRQGAVSVDGSRCDIPDKTLSRGEYLLKIGKRRFLKISID